LNAGLAELHKALEGGAMAGLVSSTHLDGDLAMTPADVRRRFAWARRQGRPAWLWPEVSIGAWRRALERIQAAVSGVLAGADTAVLSGEPGAIGLAGYTSGMGPLLGLWWEQGRLQPSAPIAAVLERHLAHNRAREAGMSADTVGVVDRLVAAGIWPLILKGAHTGHAYFPEPGVRPASDIDLLVAAADVAGAEAVLRSAGLALRDRGRWESNWRDPALGAEPRSLTFVHAEDPWSIDLHGSLNLSAGEGTPVAELDRGRPLAGHSAWPLDSRAGVLEQPLLLLHLAAHAGAGWQNLTLLRQVELVLVIRQDFAAGRLSWDAFVDLGARTGALGYAYPALRLCEALAPGAVPGPVLDRCADRTPPAVRQALARLTPASAQRIDRSSVAEHFMWTCGWRGRLRQLAADLLPDAGSWSGVFGIYEERAWRIIRGRVSQ
jgi:hypothetical protein